MPRLLDRDIIANKPIIAVDVDSSGMEEISRILSIPIAPENSSPNAENPVLEEIKRKPFISDKVARKESWPNPPLKSPTRCISDSRILKLALPQPLSGANVVYVVLTHHVPDEIIGFVTFESAKRK